MNNKLYIDKSAISPSFLKSKKFLLKLLGITSIDDFKLNRQGTVDFFNRLSDRYSENTLRLLHSTLFKCVPKFNPPIYLDDLPAFLHPKPPFYLQHPDIDKLIEEFVFQFIKSLSAVPKCFDSRYETAIVVWLTMCSNLRSSELVQITFQHVDKILACKPVQIKTKKRITSVVIVFIRPLFDQYFEYVYNYHRYVLNTKEKRVILTRKLITISDTTFNQIIRTNLIKLSKVRKINIHNQNFGIQCIRRLNTTLLSNKLSEKDVMSFNRHRSAYVSRTHYNTLTYGATKLDNMFHQLVSS